MNSPAPFHSVHHTGFCFESIGILSLEMQEGLECKVHFPGQKFIASQHIHFFSFVCSYLLFSGVEGKVAQGSKHGPWFQNALVRGLNLLPVHINILALVSSPANQCTDSTCPVGLFWKLVRSCEGLRAKTALSRCQVLLILTLQHQ